MVLLKLHLDSTTANVAALKRRYKLRSGDVDERFGVRHVDETRGIYAVRVSASAAEVITGKDTSARRQADLRVVPLGGRGARSRPASA